MTKRERNIRRAIFFAVVVAVVLLICGSLKPSGREQPTYVSYVVEPGDTLWGIASVYKPNDMRYDDYIYQLKQHNGISARIKDGQVIEVLVWKG